MGPRRSGLGKTGVGLPFVALVAGGWLGLSYMLQGRLDVKAARDRAMELRGDQPNEGKLSLEQELHKLSRKIDIDNYENKPVPR